MELYERQQFDFLLHTAVERYVERLEQRNEGATRALSRLRLNRAGEGIWLPEFVDTIFDDFLINNAEGACFVLRALSSLPAPRAIGHPVSVEQALIQAAKSVFSEVFESKTAELLEQHSAFEAAPVPGD